MTELLRCALAFFLRDAALAVSYPVAFTLGLLGKAARVLALWLPAQLLADSSLFAERGGFLAFAVIGTSVMGVFMASYGGFASAVRGEQAMGTLESVLMTPATLPAVVLGSNLWTFVNALFDALVTLVTGVWVFGIELPGDKLSALLILLLTNLGFGAIGILSAAFAVIFKKGDPFRVFVGGASFLIGGVVYPTEILPKWTQLIAEVLPVTHGVRALRGVLLEGRSLGAFSSDVAFLGAFALVGIPASVLCFSFAVRQAKRDGTLLQY